MLVENDIPAVLMNKQDSSYPVFGNIELLVDKEHQLEAVALIDSFSEEDLENED